MRPVKRIRTFLRILDLNKLNKVLNEGNPIFDKKTYIAFVKYWRSNPDLRFGQALINSNLVQDSPGLFFQEEISLIEKLNLDITRYLKWTSVYDKDNNLLKEPVTKVLADLDTDHIHTIISFMGENGKKLPEVYKKTFDKILKSRQ